MINYTKHNIPYLFEDIISHDTSFTVTCNLNYALEKSANHHVTKNRREKVFISHMSGNSSQFTIVISVQVPKKSITKVNCRWWYYAIKMKGWCWLQKKKISCYLKCLIRSYPSRVLTNLPQTCHISVCHSFVVSSMCYYRRL